MGLLNNLFESKKNNPEKLLENLYVEKFKQFGIGRKEIRDEIDKCKAKSKEEGTDNLPENYGDIIIEQSTSGSEKHKKIVEKAVSGGATEEDIRQWWNLNDLDRRMIRWEDMMFRLSTFNIFKSEGLSFEEAVIKVRKTYPLYGDPYDESNTQGDDRPLPDELHDRINRMTSEWAPLYVQQYSKNYNSMNAFIRDELRIANQEKK